MVAAAGIYQNGYVKLDKEYMSEKPVKVIVTFLEDSETPSEKGLSFSESRKALSDYKGSFSDTVVKKKRNQL